MTVVDGGYSASYAPPTYPTGGASSSHGVVPNVDGAGISSEINNATIPPDYVLTGVSPVPAVGGQTVTLTGYGLRSVQRVVMGGVASPSFTVVSDTQITAVVPTLAAGSFDIHVEGP